MSYPAVPDLKQLWGKFAIEVNKAFIADYPRMADIQKLMTAESVIDLSAHEIFDHARLVHDLTHALIQLKNEQPNNVVVLDCCDRWLNLLRRRNQIPLKLKHHQRLDGECDFRFSLQLMEGKPCGLKEIQVLDHEKNVHLDEVVQSIHRLGCLAHGMSFAGLPMMRDVILTSLMEYEDTICLVARDQSDQVIAYSWGLMLRDVEVGKNEKANIFWIMDLARDPDFFDEHARVGDALRERMAAELKLRNDCDFVGYQHILNHKFHMEIVSDEQNEDEHLHVAGAEHDARTTLQYSEDVGLFVRSHFIRISDKNHAYPEHGMIKPAILTAFWKASHSAKDFIIGGISFMGQTKYAQLKHNLLDQPIDQRISAPIPVDQQACDRNVLRQIILSDLWSQQGKGLFSKRHMPDTIGKLQNLVHDEGYDFQAVKNCVNSRKHCVSRGVNADLLYRAIDVADSPTFALNMLLESAKIPREWVESITQHRNQLLRQHEHLAQMM